jgi:hypothetical protein
VPGAADKDFIELDIAEELNRAADFAFAVRMNNNYDDEIVGKKYFFILFADLSICRRRQIIHLQSV